MNKEQEIRQKFENSIKLKIQENLELTNNNVHEQK